MLKSDCSTCHKISTTSIGPAFEKVSIKYQSDPKAVDYLANKVINGSSGVWGEIPMPAHSAMKEAEVKKITEWIMTLGNKDAVAKSLPASGKITPANNVDKKKSVLTLKATYTDAGTAKLKPLTTTNAVNLKSNEIDASDIKNLKGFEKKEVSGAEVIALTENNGSFSLSNIDLTNISGFKFNLANSTNYEVEIRLDNLEGELLGKSALKSDVAIHPVSGGKFHRVYFVFKEASGERPIIKSVTVESL